MSANSTSDGFAYDMAERENALLITLTGSADVAHASKLERCAMTAMAYRQPLVVLDLTNLAFISSIGIGSLLSMRRAAQRRGAKFRVAGVCGPLADLFATSGLTSVFSGYDTVDAALAAPN